MCGARNPRLMLPVTLQALPGEASPRPARNVTLEASQRVVGPERLAVDDGRRRRFRGGSWAALYRRSPDRRSVPGTASKASRAYTPRSGSGAYPARGRGAPWWSRSPGCRRTTAHRCARGRTRRRTAVPAGRRGARAGLDLEAVRVRPLRLVGDRGLRVAVAALVHPLLVLGVERVGGGDLVERPDAGAVVLRVEEVERQVAQVGDQVAVAAQQLVVALAVVLLGAV